MSDKPIKERIEDDHHSVRGLVADIRETTELNKLNSLLGELRSILVPHFAAEEAPSGLQSVVLDAAPHYYVKVGRLLQDHSKILSELDALNDQVLGVLKGAAHLARHIAEHEREEADLLVDSLYTDLGTGD